jgi:hypothetical protein
MHLRTHNAMHPHIHNATGVTCRLCAKVLRRLVVVLSPSQVILAILRCGVKVYTNSDVVFILCTKMLRCGCKYNRNSDELEERVGSIPILAVNFCAKMVDNSFFFNTTFPL